MVKYPPHVIKVVKCLIFITSCEDHVIDLMLGALLQSVAGKFLGIVGILVILNPTGYMFTSPGFAHSFEVYSIDSLKCSVVLLKSQTSTG